VIPAVSVVIPVYNQAAYLSRAVASLLAQSFTDWEAIVVDDGSTDRPQRVLEPYLGTDPRFLLLRHGGNRGMGAACNTGLDAAHAPLIAYLPADDLYTRDHLASLVDCLGRQAHAPLAYAGVRHRYNRFAHGVIPGSWLQPVQVLHRAGGERWLSRAELVTDDLERMFWVRLRPHGPFVGTGQITCEWVDHPGGRTRRLSEPLGGLNPYRAYYGVAAPLRFRTSRSYPVDEVAQYRQMRERPPTPPASDSLKILLVGELAYNPERVLAFEERGHRLFGLWMNDPQWFNSVGPLPFGHVEDLPRHDWQGAIRRVQPDVIYALLNWQAVPFAHRILSENPGIPFVWHFKEGPFICLEKGTWPELVDLVCRSDGQVYSSPETCDWFFAQLPGRLDRERTLVLDGDLPKRDWFVGKERAPLLSERDGAIHTVVPGRPIGLHPSAVAALAAHDIHLHFYGDFNHGLWFEWILKTLRLAPDHLHLHPNVAQPDWVEEFSRYDAGWLHFFKSTNGGELLRANWDDLNYPARIATLAAAGLPMLHSANPGALVACQNLIRERNLGILAESWDALAARLHDRPAMVALRKSVWDQREAFTFDAHVDRLVGFFRRVIAARQRQCIPS